MKTILTKYDVCPECGHQPSVGFRNASTVNSNGDCKACGTHFEIKLGDRNGNVILWGCTNPEFENRAQRAREAGQKGMIDTGCRVDPDGDLVASQMEAQRAGFVMVRISKNVYGFCVRDTMNDGGGNLSGNFETPEEVVRWAYDWYMEKPALREVIAYSSDFERVREAYENFTSPGPSATCQICRGMHLNPWTFGNPSEFEFHTKSVHGIGTLLDKKTFPPSLPECEHCGNRRLPKCPGSMDGKHTEISSQVNIAAEVKKDDIVLITSRMKKGTEIRIARIWKDSERINEPLRNQTGLRIFVEPPSCSTSTQEAFQNHPELQTTGTGSILVRDEIGEFGVQKIEIIGSQKDWKAPENGWMIGHPGYDLG